jgi:hypothetical protein
MAANGAKMGERLNPHRLRPIRRLVAERPVALPPANRWEPTMPGDPEAYRRHAARCAELALEAPTSELRALNAFAPSRIFRWLCVYTLSEIADAPHTMRPAESLFAWIRGARLTSRATRGP